jgi:general secretion pathway protein M
MTEKKKSGKFSKEGARGLILLIGTALVLVAIAIAPYVWQVAMASTVAERREFLALLEARVRASPQQSTALNPDTVETIFIKGTTSGLAAAELQRLLVDTGEKRGMIVERTRPLPTENRQGMASIRMEVNASGNIEALRDYLHGIETSVPLIFVNQVHIAAGPAATDGEASDNLAVRLEVEAFAWWDKAS